MPPRIQVISILICILLVAYVFELVRRKHLSEEYSMGWLITGTLMLILSVSEDAIRWVSSLVGATLFTSTLFFFGLLFLMVICLHFSICISALTQQVRTLTQHIGILDHEKKLLEKKIHQSPWETGTSNLEQT
ncbi:MAG: hypothetical protein COW89_11000 [Nitrospinae bacterium CG22_combo_CG10-13_8_21_14_all_47_10]|nr:MAG: hypothetical protein COW89_11000 [Nitrospinae bacterium CG22_combo_CG10-13_8_21_14_all_47_10]